MTHRRIKHRKRIRKFKFRSVYLLKKYLRTKTKEDIRKDWEEAIDIIDSRGLVNLIPL